MIVIVDGRRGSIVSGICFISLSFKADNNKHFKTNYKSGTIIFYVLFKVFSFVRKVSEVNIDIFASKLKIIKRIEIELLN